jgi:hypothetical protein
MKKPKKSKTKTVEQESVLIVPDGPNQLSDYRLVARFDKSDSFPIKLEASDYAESVYISLEPNQAKLLAETLTRFYQAIEKREQGK